MIFLSDFLHADVVDVHQKTISSVRDLIVRVQKPYPKVTTIMMQPRSDAPESIG